MKEIFKIIIIRLFVAGLIGCGAFFLMTPSHPRFKDCGVVTVKDKVGINQKHGIRVESLLGVQFEKSGFRAIEVSETTYMGNDIGSYVCFDLDEDVSSWYMIAHCVGMLVIVICIILLSVIFCSWLFNINLD